MQDSDDTQDLKGKVDFGVITVREDEFEAILKRLPTQRLIHGRLTYALSTLTTTNDDEYQIASVRCPEQGNVHGQSVAHTLIEELDPQWLLLIGIAGSIPNDEYTLGDVLLAARLHNFSVSASIEDSQQQTRQEYSEGGGPMHPKVQDLIAHLPALTPFLEPWYEADSIGVPRPHVSFSASKFYGDADWKKNIRLCLGRYFGKSPVRDHPKAITGSIASSDTLVKSTHLASEWLKVARQIRGVEMELAGVYQAAWTAQKPVLAIRGISDIVGYKRSAEWTNYACNTAASFAHALLRSRPIRPLAVQAERSVFLPIAGIAMMPSEPVGIFRNKPVHAAHIQKDERLFSNLLEVSYFPPKLYTVRTSCADRKEIWSTLRHETEYPATDWIYKGKTLYAFHDFSDPIWQKVCETSTLEEHDTSDWSDSDDVNRRAEFIELMKGCLKELGRTHDLYYSHHPRVRKRRKRFEHLYFAPTSEYSGSAFLEITDLINPYDFIINLKDRTTPVARHLFAQLSDATRQLIAGFSYQNQPNRDLLRPLVQNLNEVLKLRFYQQDCFTDVYVRRDAKQLIEAETIDDEDLIHLNRMLLEDAFPNEVFKRSLCQRTLVRQSVVQSRPRVVFKAYYSRARKFSHYRHHAFRFQFTRVEGKWYLEITPTYHYTHDGHRVCWFYEDLVKGIKRIETNEAVFRQVLFWAEVLQDSRHGFFHGPSYPYLRFRRLAEFKSDFGVPDQLWASKESLRLKRASESQSSLTYES